MVEAVVYTSNTGHTKKYAEMAAEELKAKACDLKKEMLPKGTSVVYMGWLCAGSIKGYKAAAKRYNISAVCAVGMAREDEKQVTDVIMRHNLGGKPFFYLQGGFAMEKLRGPYKWMMKVMASSVGAGLQKKANRTAEEEEMLDLVLNGGDRVSREALEPLLQWGMAEK